jgi:hypothetical protein
MSHDKPNNPSAATPQTDAEAGEEGDDIQKSKRALKVMFNRGLIDKETYQDRLSNLTSGDQSD